MDLKIVDTIEPSLAGLTTSVLRIGLLIQCCQYFEGRMVKKF